MITIFQNLHENVKISFKVYKHWVSVTIISNFKFPGRPHFGFHVVNWF